MGSPRHFLDLDCFDTKTLNDIFMLAHEEKRNRCARPFAGKTLAMIFEKPSTRTRVSFEVGVKQLGGEVVILSQESSQLGRGETIADTARVLSRYVDAIMIRTDRHDKLLELAEYASVPVINGLTDRTHPCQVMADIMTFEEHRGSLAGKVITWVGDGNNVASSWIQAAAHYEFEMRVATPESLEPDEDIVIRAREKGAKIILGNDPVAAVSGADCVMTDTWVSMGQEAGARHNLLFPYQVNEKLMALAKPDALFMHCLPAHREEEVTSAVMDGRNSVVWDEAENRLHAQKGILIWCLMQN